MLCDYSLRTEPHRHLKTQICLRLSRRQENIDKLYLSSFLLIYIIIIYRLLARHATIADYLTTIPQLLRDYFTRGAAAGNMQVLSEIAFYSQNQAKAAEKGAKWEKLAVMLPPCCAGQDACNAAAYFRTRLLQCLRYPLFAPELPFKRMQTH